MLNIWSWDVDKIMTSSRPSVICLSSAPLLLCLYLLVARLSSAGHLPFICLLPVLTVCWQSVRHCLQSACHLPVMCCHLPVICMPSACHFLSIFMSSASRPSAICCCPPPPHSRRLPTCPLLLSACLVPAICLMTARRLQAFGQSPVASPCHLNAICLPFACYLPGICLPLASEPPAICLTSAPICLQFACHLPAISLLSASHLPANCLKSACHLPTVCMPSASDLPTIYLPASCLTSA